MIIDRVKITNFGLYRGETIVELFPENLKDRNITVISGQNGVGKSTLQEAIHLCLLGSLSIDTRVTESNYERYLFKRSYKGPGVDQLTSSVELYFQFYKSGATVDYKVKRSWVNHPNDPAEEISIEENGKELTELNKKEKNLFLRELIQPGLAKVMFFDGEKLLALYDHGNLAQFIGDSCRYLFGLNFVELLNSDLNYYIQKLHAQQDPSQQLQEIGRVRNELQQIKETTVKLETEKTDLIGQLNTCRQEAHLAERSVAEQGRWATGTQEQLMSEKIQLEKDIAQLKKELVEQYSSTGPFVFCRDLCRSLEQRLHLERETEKWQHASDLFKIRLADLGKRLSAPGAFQQMGVDQETGEKFMAVVSEELLSGPVNAQGLIYHELTDGERSKLLAWIEQVLHVVSDSILTRSENLAKAEERFKAVGKELNAFSREDLIMPMLKHLQEVNRQVGIHEQKLDQLNRRTDENNKRHEYYSTRLDSLEAKLVSEQGIDERLRLSGRTRQVLEAYAQELMVRKLATLKDKVLDKFNRLCRKDSYLDELTIDPKTFELELSRQGKVVDHAHLSAGEKQLLVLALIWGLRELTNIALPLIIDTPLARLDLEHRRSFIEEFLPDIQPQVILIGTDMELAGDVIEALEPHIAHQYVLVYQHEQQATQLVTVNRSSVERMAHEI